jgi:uncharacterized protein YheU (UPF0270 family)
MLALRPAAPSRSAVVSPGGDRSSEVEIPFRRLAPDTLRRLIEEFVTRDGTDHGDLDHSLEDRVQAVQRQLERSEALIDFDPDTETCTVLPVASGSRRR